MQYTAAAAEDVASAGAVDGLTLLRLPAHGTDRRHRGLCTFTRPQKVRSSIVSPAQLQSIEPIILRRDSFRYFTSTISCAISLFLILTAAVTDMLIHAISIIKPSQCPVLVTCKEKKTLLIAAAAAGGARSSGLAARRCCRRAAPK